MQFHTFPLCLITGHHSSLPGQIFHSQSTDQISHIPFCGLVSSLLFIYPGLLYPRCRIWCLLLVSSLVSTNHEDGDCQALQFVMVSLLDLSTLKGVNSSSYLSVICKLTQYAY